MPVINVRTLGVFLLRFKFFAIACFIGAFSSIQVATASKFQTEANFQSYALNLRQASIERKKSAIELWNLIPGITRMLPDTSSETERNDALELIWGSFFENTIVRTADEQSIAPKAIYYNPLLDIALVTVWQQTDQSYQINDLRIVAGERIANPKAELLASPPWMLAKKPFETITKVTKERFQAFNKAIKSKNSIYSQPNYESAALSFAATQPRLAWNIVQRQKWTDRWVSQTAEIIEFTLQLDKAALINRAPKTNSKMADILTGLPDEFKSRLILDMVLEYQEKERLLIVSAADDGQVYIIVRCLLNPRAGSCPPFQYMLLSLPVI